jgi:hypothetical protein
MTNEKKVKKKKKKGYVPRPIGKGEMVDVGRTFHTIPSLFDFEKEVKRLSKAPYVDASYVQLSNGAIYKANATVIYQGEYKQALFLLVKRTVMGVLQYQMTRIFTSNDNNEGNLGDLLIARVKGVEYHMKW